MKVTGIESSDRFCLVDIHYTTPRYFEPSCTKVDRVCSKWSKGTYSKSDIRSGNTECPTQDTLNTKNCSFNTPFVKKLEKHSGDNLFWTMNLGLLNLKASVPHSNTTTMSPLLMLCPRGHKRRGNVFPQRHSTLRHDMTWAREGWGQAQMKKHSGCYEFKTKSKKRVSNCVWCNLVIYIYNYILRFQKTTSPQQKHLEPCSETVFPTMPSLCV